MTEQNIDVEAGPQRAGLPGSQQVSWWPVYEFVTAAVAQANCGPLPAAGTPAWCALADGDPRKMLAAAVEAPHHVLRKETAQAAMADASREISAAANWTTVAQLIRGRSGNAYIPRRAS